MKKCEGCEVEKEISCKMHRHQILAPLSEVKEGVR